MYFESTLADRARKFLRLVTGRRAFPPGDITVELTTRCGRGCAVCFREPLGVKPADMPEPLYRRVLEEIKAAYAGGAPRYLNFVGLGEPFAHPEIERFLRLAAAELPGAQLNVSTGLAPFGREAFARLAADGVLNRLSVSLDCLDAEGPLHRFTPEVKENLDFLAALKRERPAFKIRVQTLLSTRPAAEAAVRAAAAAGAGEVQLLRADLHAFAGEPPFRRPGYAAEREIVAAASALGASLGLRCRNNNDYTFFMDLASGWDRGCLITDDHVFITAEGDLIPCFYLRGEAFGNLGRQTLAEACAARPPARPFAREAAGCAGCDIYKRRHHHGEGR